MAGMGEVRAGGAYLEVYAKDATGPGVAKIAAGVKRRLGNIPPVGIGGAAGPGTGRGVAGFLRGMAPVGAMAGLGPAIPGMAAMAGGMASAGPLAAVGASLAALGAAALNADRILRETSKGYESPLTALAKAAKGAFEELGFAILPVVHAIAKALTPAFDWLAAKIKEYAPFFLEFAAGFADALQYVHKGFAILKAALYDVAHVASMVANDLTFGALFGDDFVKEMEDASRKAAADAKKAWNAKPWGDTLRDAAKEINRARANIGKKENLPSNVKAPEALLAGSQAVQDYFAQTGADKQLDEMRRQTGLMEEIRDNTAAPTGIVAGSLP